MRVKVSELKKAIRLSVIEEEIRLAQNSLDDQIDSILLGFESDAFVSDEEPEDEIAPMEGLVDLPLLEAPEDEEQEEDPADEEPAEEPSAEEPAEDEAPPEDAAPDDADIPSDTAQPKIDVAAYATKVARLSQAYQNLLDIPIVITTRAYNHLLNNYDQSVADEFEEIMSRDHGVETERQPTSEPESLPIAVGAGASGQ